MNFRIITATVRLLTPQVTRCLIPHPESGQAAVEYVYLALGVAIAVALIGFGVQADGINEFGQALSERILMITTILKLPI